MVSGAWYSAGWKAADWKYFLSRLHALPNSSFVARVVVRVPLLLLVAEQLSPSHMCVWALAGPRRVTQSWLVAGDGTSVRVGTTGVA